MCILSGLQSGFYQQRNWQTTKRREKTVLTTIWNCWRRKATAGLGRRLASQYLCRRQARPLQKYKLQKETGLADYRILYERARLHCLTRPVWRQVDDTHISLSKVWGPQQSEWQQHEGMSFYQGSLEVYSYRPNVRPYATASSSGLGNSRRSNAQDLNKNAEVSNEGVTSNNLTTGLPTKSAHTRKQVQPPKRRLGCQAHLRTSVSHGLRNTQKREK